MSILIDEDKLRGLVLPFEQDTPYEVNAEQGVVTLGKFAFPLSLVSKEAVRTERGACYPKAAYASVPSNDPGSWDILLWESPTLGVTERSLQRVFEELAPGGAYANRQLSDQSLQAITRAYRDVWGEDAPLPPRLGETPGDTSVIVMKPGIDETDSSFRYRVRNPSQFKTMRTISISNGIQGVVGKKGPGSPMQLQSLIFSKTRFKTRDEVAAYLRSHPNLKKSAGTEAAVAAGELYEQEGYKWFPTTTKSEAPGFLLRAVFPNLPSELEGMEVSPESLIGQGWAHYFSLQCESWPHIGLWEMTWDSFPTEDQMVVGWVSAVKNTDGTPAPSGNCTSFIMDEGTYTLVSASPTTIAVKFSGKHLTKTLTFNGRESWWVGEESDLSTPELESLLKSLNVEGADWLLWPKDRRGGGSGYHIVDVAKTIQHEMNYNVLKSTPEQRYTLGLAYPANRLDKHGDFATAEQLERTAWTYMVHKRSVGVGHLPGTDGAGTVVESYIYRGPEWQITKDTTVRPGDWLLGVVWTEKAWGVIKSGRITGFSIQGWAKR